MARKRHRRAGGRARRRPLPCVQTCRWNDFPFDTNEREVSNRVYRGSSSTACSCEKAPTRVARGDQARPVRCEGTRPLTSGWGSKNEGVPEGSPEGSPLPSADDETFHRGSTRPPSRRLGVWSSERSLKEGRAPAYFKRLNIQP